MKNAKTLYFGKNPQISSDDLRSKYHHSIKNLIRHIIQVVSKSTQVYNECQQWIPAWKTQNLVFRTKRSISDPSPLLKIPLFDREYYSAYYSTGFRVNTGIWANVSNEYQLEKFKTLVFRKKLPVFVQWASFEVSPFDREFNSAHHSSDFRLNTGICANVSKDYSNPLLTFLISSLRVFELKNLFQNSPKKPCDHSDFTTLEAFHQYISSINSLP